MKNEFVETKSAMSFWEAVNFVSDKQNGREGMVLVWGYSGRGKTECARTYATRNKNVVYVRACNKWTPLDMMKDICEGLNGMMPRSMYKARRIILEEVDDSNKILLLDEADRLTIDHIECLRDIHDKTGFPIVLIGEPVIYARIKARVRIWRRFTWAVEFGPLLAEDVIMFGVKNCSLKIEPRAAKMLVDKSKGCFGFLTLYMSELEGMAKSNDLKEISYEIVKDLRKVEDFLPKPKQERYLK